MKQLLIVLGLNLSALTIYSQTSSDFIRAKDNQLVIGAGETPIRLKGTNLGNNDANWLNYSNLYLTFDHTKDDYQKICEMGMNVVRLLIDCKFFEDVNVPYTYHQEGWDYVDSNITWAKNNNIFLILGMFITQGGPNISPDNPIWTDTELQSRLIALWKAIAERYKNEVYIAGYDIFNEPFPKNGHAQWKTLAQDIVDEIRTVDNNHLIIVEESFAYADKIMPQINDNNVMYDFHFYNPHLYSHSYCDKGDGGFYPDTNISLTGDYLVGDVIFADSLWTAKTPLGDSDWEYYETGLYEITDPFIVQVIPVMRSNKNQGTIYFDDFILEEYDSLLNPVRSIHVDLEYYSELFTVPGIDPMISYIPDWIVEKANGDTGDSDTAGFGHSGSNSLYIKNVSVRYELNNDQFGYLVKQGYYYKIGGWMKGAGVTDGSGQIGLKLYKHTDISEFTPFDKNYLEKVILDKIQFGINNNVPMNVGEFGLMKYNFMDSIGGLTKNRGGMKWIQDMVDLFDKYNLNFQHFGYHVWSFGMYTNHGTMPDPEFANHELISYFTENLNACQSLVSIPNNSKKERQLNVCINIAKEELTIQYYIPESEHIALDIFNIHGRKIKTLVNNFQLQGNYTIKWDTYNLVNGIYILRLQNNENIICKKVIILN